MKLVIDIDEKMYEDCKTRNTLHYSLYNFSSMIANGTPLPKDATNRDMIETMFPDVEIEENPVKKKCGCFYLKFKGNTCTMITDYSWWNAPYKRGGEDEV